MTELHRVLFVDPTVTHRQKISVATLAIVGLNFVLLIISSGL